ncbi:MAG: Holliday junction resolvase RuvX [Clostridiales bacterium]|nr:Holliday junction resolvase RuvX [Clostridiales bacterium]
MVILGVDYGDARTGLAVCDKSELLASPAGVICERNTERLVSKIASVAAQKGCEAIAVGCPKNMDGSCGFRAQACMEFAQLLGKACALPVSLWDERLTTVSAHNVLNESDVRGKKRKAIIDEVAAVMILQDFLDYRKNNR